MLAAAVLAVVVALGVVVLSGSDDSDVSPDALTDTTTEAGDGAEDVLDELFPDRPTPAPDAEPTPTADPAGSTVVAQELTVQEAVWAPNAFGELDVVALVRNDGPDAYANVVVDVAVLDASGARLDSIELAISRVEPGHVVPVTSQLELDAAAVADVVVAVQARGTVPPKATSVVADVEWQTDDTGTTFVTGTISAPELIEFVAIVAIMSDEAGDYLGFAFGLVDGVDQTSRAWEATGFPTAEVATIAVFTTG